MEARIADQNMSGCLEQMLEAGVIAERGLLLSHATNVPIREVDNSSRIIEIFRLSAGNRPKAAFIIPTVEASIARTIIRNGSKNMASKYR